MKYMTIDEAAEALANKYKRSGADLYAEELATMTPQQRAGIDADFKDPDRQRADGESRRAAREHLREKSYRQEIEDSLRDDIKQAALRGELKIFNPMRLTPANLAELRTYVHVVKISDVDAWLAKAGSYFRIEEAAASDERGDVFRQADIEYKNLRQKYRREPSKAMVASAVEKAFAVRGAESKKTQAPRKLGTIYRDLKGRGSKKGWNPPKL